MRYAVVDVETTGFSPVHDRIVEVACVLVEHGAVRAAWSSLVNPGREIPYYATAVHGIGNADVAFAPHFEDVAPVLAALCEECTVVAHNAAFDLGFLPMLQHHRSICTVRLARRVFPGAPNYKNQTLRAYLGLDADPALRGLNAHRALGDALVTAAIFLRCLQVFEGPHARPA
ncbi:MAG TPA: 3'-5' exonuclease [Candidatus Baltobacteraceae bacterium]|jgi:DNA polymerase III epsilon subunit-like protein|nr:3'-5' exonuclease [Candidatus Baltobacteraceae bacterium]